MRKNERQHIVLLWSRSIGISKRTYCASRQKLNSSNVLFVFHFVCCLLVKCSKDIEHKYDLFDHLHFVVKMDSLCRGLNSCGSCCLSECKWVTFENKTESCHSTVEYLEDVVKMVDTVGNCSAPFNPPDEELIKGERIRKNVLLFLFPL